MVLNEHRYKGIIIDDKLVVEKHGIQSRSLTSKEFPLNDSGKYPVYQEAIHDEEFLRNLYESVNGGTPISIGKSLMSGKMIVISGTM